MNSQEIFAAGLELPSPWFVTDVHLVKKGSGKILHIYIDHEKRVKFEYESQEYPVYDHQPRIWRHLSFFQHKCHIHAQVPRVKLDDGKVRLIAVPWAQSGTSFTLLFEYDVLDLAEGSMSARRIGQRLGIGGKTVFGIIHRHVSHALSTQELEEVKELSVDETSSSKGHKYVTILGDRKAKKVVGISIGKDKDAFCHALVDMELRGANRESVKSITMDMSTSYISAAAEFMAQADIVFDRFHIAKKMNEAVDQIRRQDQREYHGLTNTRYLWLKNYSNLTQEQQAQVNELSQLYENTGKAHRLKELLKEVLDNAYNSQRLTPLNEWMAEAWNSELEPIQKFVNMLRRHWYGIKGYFKRRTTNAYAERVNLKIQEIKRTAKGYRNTNNFMTMIYFHLGGLDLKPTLFD